MGVSQRRVRRQFLCDLSHDLFRVLLLITTNLFSSGFHSPDIVVSKLVIPYLD